VTAPTVSTRRATTTAAPAPDRDWRTQGACVDEDPELFHPAGKTGAYLVQARAAKKVCRRCPVRQMCLGWALNAREMHGIYGGMDEDERQKLLRRTRRIDAPRSDRKWVQILRKRLPEYQALVAQGLSVSEIARAMDTTVQTVNSVQHALRDQAAWGVAS
jgi:WhiB family transcriptional regulator, redox-sensing transcriptional regulator